MRCARIIPTLLLFVVVTLPVWAAEPPVVISPGQDGVDDMRRRSRSDGTAGMAPPAQESTRRAFKTEYSAARGSKRPVFEKYLDTLGADGILDVLETAHPLCHSQAHELGRVIVARLKDLGVALSACKTRCTSGCMHGVLMEAFGGPSARSAASAHHGGAHQHGAGHQHDSSGPLTVADVEARMVPLCSETGDLAKLYEPGNCAPAWAMRSWP